ncbi:MAG: chemotaxis protein CheW [Clostridiales bacterium]|nr:chemotaxis protein CheW [Clostridiales bacterium]
MRLVLFELNGALCAADAKPVLEIAAYSRAPGSNAGDGNAPGNSAGGDPLPPSVGGARSPLPPPVGGVCGSLPPFIDGVCDSRGGRIPVVDLNRRFRLGAAAGKAKVIVYDVKGMRLGFAVNAVREIRLVGSGELKPVPPCAATDENRAYLPALLLSGGCVANVIDMERVLGEAELRACRDSAALSSAPAQG